jgi:hypothetical protein
MIIVKLNLHSEFFPTVTYPYKVLYAYSSVGVLQDTHSLSLSFFKYISLMVNMVVLCLEIIVNLYSYMVVF